MKDSLHNNFWRASLQIFLAGKAEDPSFLLWYFYSELYYWTFKNSNFNLYIVFIVIIKKTILSQKY